MKRWQRWWTTAAITKILTINDCGRKFAGRHLQTAITYIIDPNKTQNMRYVTGINCQPEKAFDQMLATKQKFGKTDKRQGYHIIISFEEENVEPGTAFEIIRKFVEEYLGQGYEAIYAVHLCPERLEICSYLQLRKYCRM